MGSYSQIAPHNAYHIRSPEHARRFGIDVVHYDGMNLFNEVDIYSFIISISIFDHSLKILDLVNLPQGFAFWRDVIYEQVICFFDRQGIPLYGGGSLYVIDFKFLFIFL